ncbi:MAG: hypothetical protein E3J87_02015 [Candidatus Cloacimonadota bacterium]|nr:MAG: hypothetical protein E3J87_02015 [Candidatus Cloacimonadota bacterium]
MKRYETAEEELLRRDRKRMKAKTMIAEHQQKQTDPLLSHTAQVHEDRRLPHILPSVRAWWWRLFCWATATPQHRPLMALCARELYNVEGVISRWLVLPEILDEDLETDYKALLSRYQSSVIDYSGIIEEEEDKS